MKARTPESTRQSAAEQEGASQRPERDDDTELLHFPLAGILPEGHILAVHPRLRIVAHLTYEAGAPLGALYQHQRGRRCH